MAANWWYRRGGLGAVMFDEARELQRRGHEVFPFAAAHPQNEPTPWSRFFPEFRETGDLGRSMSLGRQASTAIRLLHNSEAAGCFGRLIDEARPDIVHLHSAARQLSPAILAVARRRCVPIVMTQHDYQLVCPQGHLLKGYTTPCTPPSCIHGNPLHVVTNRCVRGRFLPSAVAGVEYGLHRSRGAYHRRAELLLAPSRFMEGMLLDAGMPAASVRYLANGIPPAIDPAPVPEVGGYLMYAGRLSPEKGLDVLVEACQRLPQVPVLIAGDGPMRMDLERAAPPTFRFVGTVSADELIRLRAGSFATVSPSTWYENAPISVLESMRDGRATIATDIGGQPELLASEAIGHAAGILVRPGDGGGLAEAIQALWRDRPRARRLGEEGHRRMIAEYTLAGHVARLEGLYQEAIDGRGRLARAGSQPGPDRPAAR